MRISRSLILTVCAAGLVLLSVATATATADPLWPKQYGPPQIGAPTAWQKSTGAQVKVAVVDTGVDINHPDLQDNFDLLNSHDFACNDNNPDDDSELQVNGRSVKGHGTHVTGTIAATANNNIGVAGVAPNVTVMVEKVFGTDNTCGGTLSNLATNTSSAIDWAVSHGAKAINLSLSEFKFGNLVSTIQSPCNKAFAKGVVCVVAAGNDGENTGSGYDHNFNGIIVTANDANGKHADFAQKADTKWAVSAPGAGIMSTWPTSDGAHDGYNYLTGTSMAAPHVTGAVALLLASGMSAQQAVDALMKSAGPTQDSDVEGAGIIHVERALGLQSATTATTRTIARPSSGGSGGGGQSTSGAGAGPKVTSKSGVPSGPDDFADGFLTGGDSTTTEVAAKQASADNAGDSFNPVLPLLAMVVLIAGVVVAVLVRRAQMKNTPPPLT